MLLEPEMSNADGRPLVSIVTPMYNSARYLRETVESVLRQRYAHWQLILADDGSKDDSLAIAEDYSRHHPSRIIAVSHESRQNRGASATRNLAITFATGSLVAFLDSDDIWNENYLMEQVADLERMPEVDTVLEATRYWYSWADPAAQDVVTPVGAASGVVYRPPRLATILYPLTDRSAPCPTATVIRMSALKKIEAFEECFIGKDQLYEDQAFAIKNYLHNTVYIASRANNLHRQRGDSLMHGLIAGGFSKSGRRFFLHWMRDYLARQHIDDAEVQRLLGKAILRDRYEWLLKYFRLSNYVWKLKALMPRF